MGIPAEKKKTCSIKQKQIAFWALLDSTNSYQDFIRILLSVSTTCLLSTYRDIPDNY
jgi:hypothetical protein